MKNHLLSRQQATGQSQLQQFTPSITQLTCYTYSYNTNHIMQPSNFILVSTQTTFLCFKVVWYQHKKETKKKHLKSAHTSPHSFTSKLELMSTNILYVIRCHVTVAWPLFPKTLSCIAQCTWVQFFISNNCESNSWWQDTLPAQH